MSNIPNMQSVSSSNIDAVGHDADANELHVRFYSGAHYIYSGVDAEAHAALVAAPSIGSHFAREIKNGHSYRPLKA